MTSSLRGALPCLLAMPLLGGCFLSRTGGALPDGAADGPDAARTDAGRPDAESPDARTPTLDGGRRDGGPGIEDAGATLLVDGGRPDAFVPMDAGPPDSGCVDDAPMGALLVIARPAGVITLDGDLAEWRAAEWVSIAAPGDWVGGGSPDAADISARLAAQWSAGALYVAVEVTDDQHANGRSGNNLWRGDCLQLGFDVADNGGVGYDNTDDFEYGHALSGGAVERHRWVAPAGAAAPVDQAEIVRAGSTTTYEIRFAPSDLGLATLSRGRQMGFEWVLDEDDGSGDRQGFLEWSSGLGGSKNPGNFGALHLAGPACALSPSP